MTDTSQERINKIAVLELNINVAIVDGEYEKALRLQEEVNAVYNDKG